MKRRHRLRILVRFSLFVTSYLPLFFIMCFRQTSQHFDYLHWGGLTASAIMTWLKYFGIVCFFIALSIIGIAGLSIFLKNITTTTETNGDNVRVTDIENKNSEAITYLFTYIIPFVFQNLSSLPDIISLLMLLGVTYFIYINSNLILINPSLNLKYALYSIEYVDNFHADSLQSFRTMIITKNKFVEEGDHMLIKKLSHKLYFAVPIAEDDNGNEQ